MGMNLTDLAFMGHLQSDDNFPGATSKTFLAAGSVALTWMQLTNNFLYSGMVGALQTLTSQAYGAGNSKLMLAWLQIALVSTFLACIPVAGLWWFSGDIMHAALGAKCASNCKELATTFSRFSIIKLPFSVAFAQIASYCRSRKIVKPQVYIGLLSLALNLGLNYFFIYGFTIGGHPIGGFGFKGSPISTAVAAVVQLSLLISYMFLYLKIHKREIEAPSNQVAVRQASEEETYVWSWVRFKRYLRLSLPLAVGGQLEEAQMQTVSFFAGSISQAAIGAHNGILNIILFLTSIQWSLMQATTIRIGHHLGEASILKCKRVLTIASIIGFAIGIIISLIFILAKGVIGKLFTSDPAVLALAEPLCYLAGAGYFALTIFYVSMAVLQAQGRTMSIAFAFLVGAWAFGVPLAYLFGRVVVWRGVAGGLGLQGLWYGLSVGYMVTSFIAVKNVYDSDWPRLCEEALTRSEAQVRIVKRSSSADV